jgi:serine/threonine protein phosphatase 1
MVYVCSDIHGHYETFLKMLEILNLKKKDKLYILGDVIDRGPDGIKILEWCMEDNNIELLLGNHEIFLIDYLTNLLKENHSEKNFNEIFNIFDFRRLNGDWIYNGGMETFYGLQELSLDKIHQLYEYLLDLPFMKIITVNGKRFYLTHSIPFNESLMGSEPFHLNNTVITMRECLKDKNLRFYYENSLWYRINDPENIVLKGADTLISGHTPVPLLISRNYPSLTIEDILVLIHKKTGEKISQSDIFNYEPDELSNTIKIFHNQKKTYYDIDCGMAMASNLSSIGVLELETGKEQYVKLTTFM